MKDVKLTSCPDCGEHTGRILSDGQVMTIECDSCGYALDEYPISSTSEAINEWNTASI